jgi:hypothetical protein
MSLFARHISVGISGILFLIFVANLVVTLILTNDLRLGVPVDSRQLLFVQVCNYLFATVLVLSMLAATVFTPFVLYYRANTESLKKTGLRYASTT